MTNMSMKTSILLIISRKQEERYGEIIDLLWEPQVEESGKIPILFSVNIQEDL